MTGSKKRDFFKCGYYKIETEYERKKQQCVTLEKDIEDLCARLTKAEGRLARHESLHTPSSQKLIGQKNSKTDKDKPDRSKERSKKPGVQKGRLGIAGRYKPAQFKTRITHRAYA